jgi:hypothetical protein
MCMCMAVRCDAVRLVKLYLIDESGSIAQSHEGSESVVVLSLIRKSQA